MPNYEIRQGEHVARVIRSFGFTDPDAVWRYGSNPALGDRTRTPTTLAPGDVLAIPERVPKTVQRPPDQRHRVQVAQRALHLRLVLRTPDAHPVANVPCTLRFDDREIRLRSGANGEIEAEIPSHLETAELTIGEHAGPLSGTTLALLIGHLDPLGSVTGQEARLDNLGYRAGSTGNPSDPGFRSAVEEFQCDEGLTVDGLCGPKTQARLKSVHGS